MTESDDRQHRQAYFNGRVQGVGFRYTVRQLASELDVSGFVRNLADGRVELQVEGKPNEIDRLIAAIRDHFGRYITRVDEQSSPPKRKFSGFEIRH